MKITKPGDACPSCGKPLKLRSRKKDNLPFLGCSSFPECRYTEPYEGGELPVPNTPKETKVNNYLVLSDDECVRLLEMAYYGLEDNKDVVMLDIIAKIEEYRSSIYKKTKPKVELPEKGQIPF